jgi:hypothetical protein
MENLENGKFIIHDSLLQNIDIVSIHNTINNIVVTIFLKKNKDLKGNLFVVVTDFKTEEIIKSYYTSVRCFHKYYSKIFFKTNCKVYKPENFYDKSNSTCLCIEIIDIL